jgi:hypothetical protein
MKKLFAPFFIILVHIAFAQTDAQYDHIVDSLGGADKTEILIPYFQSEVKSKPKNEAALRWLGYLYISTNQLDLSEKISS